MEAKHLDIFDVILLKPKISRDERGFFSETYNARDLAQAGIDAVFVQDNHSGSQESHVIRGLHFQAPPFAQGKLVRVVRGAAFDVAVDLRRGSPSYGQHVSAVLSCENWHQLWIPEGFAHGYCTLEPGTEVFYKVTNFYAPDHEAGVAFDDPALGIDWPLPAGVRPRLSERDRRLPVLSELTTAFASAPSARPTQQPKTS